MKLKKTANKGIQPTSVEARFGFGFCLPAGRLMSVIL
jgi:hypothetical protein